MSALTDAFEHAHADLGSLWLLSQGATWIQLRVTRRSKRTTFVYRDRERSVRSVELEGESRGAWCGPLHDLVYTEAQCVAVFGPRWREPGRRAIAGGSLESFTRLGLAFPATADEVRRAYRDLAKVAHPDAGGSSEAFIELRQSYERALEMVGGAP